jgi:hypothetical protein
MLNDNAVKIIVKFSCFIVFLWAASFLLQTPAAEAAAPTYFHSASNPADNGTGADNSILAVTPPASMNAGDLVVLVGQLQDATTGNITVSETGGQTWSSVSEAAANDMEVAVFWAQYNGTWSANPSLNFASIAGTQPATAVMHVFRPASVGSGNWVVDTAFAGGAEASASPTVITGITPAKRDNVTLAGWAIPNASTWGTLSGTGWAAMETAQWRNTSGSDQSMTFAHQLQSAPAATNDVSQAPSTAAAGVSFTMAWSFQLSPTVALNSPADASSDTDTTPTFNFTGTDANSDTLEYNVQVDTVNSFDSTDDFFTTSTKTLASGENYALSITDDANYIYVGTYASPAKVVRITKSDFSTTSTKTLASGENATYSITDDANYIYVGTDTAPAKVVRISKSDFSTTSTKTLASGEDYTYSITNDTDYIYVGTYTAPAKVVRISKSDFSTTSTKTLATGEDYAYSITDDTDYIYVGTYTTPAKVVRITKSDFSTTSTKTLASGENSARSITDDANYIYVGTFTSPAKVVRISKSDFSTTSTKTLASGENIAYSITNDTDYIYVGMNTSPAKVVRISKSDFSTTSTKTLASGENIARSITDDTDYIYVGTDTSPAKVVRISKTTPLINKFSTTDAGFTAGHPFASGSAIDYTVQAGDALSAGTYYWRVAAIDPSGSNIYGAWATTRSFTVTAAVSRVIRLSGKVKFIGKVKVY